MLEEKLKEIKKSWPELYEHLTKKHTYSGMGYLDYDGFGEKKYKITGKETLQDFIIVDEEKKVAIYLKRWDEKRKREGYVRKRSRDQETKVKYHPRSRLGIFKGTEVLEEAVMYYTTPGDLKTTPYVRAIDSIESVSIEEKGKEGKKYKFLKIVVKEEDWGDKLPSERSATWERYEKGRTETYTFRI